MIAPFSSWREYHLLVSLPELLSAAEIPFPAKERGKLGREWGKGAQFPSRVLFVFLQNFKRFRILRALLSLCAFVFHNFGNAPFSLNFKINSLKHLNYSSLISPELKPIEFYIYTL